MEELKKCPCCATSNFNQYAAIKDYSVTQKVFKLSSCSNCGFIFTNPRPDAQEIGPYYASANYVPHHSGGFSLFHFLYRIIRKIMYKKKLKRIEHNISTPLAQLSLLDYGAASGEFLQYCQTQNIHNTIGIEPDETCRKTAENQYKLSLKPVAEIKKIPTASLEVITLWHVLEHIHDLEETVTIFSQLLKKDGILVISVPNNKCLDRAIYGDYWAAYDVPRHLYHFNTSAITTLMSRFGFSLENKYAMPFDAYYIALHSEWYKKAGKINAIFNAIKNGWLSNQSAKNTGEYSSLMYVFKKQ